MLAWQVVDVSSWPIRIPDLRGRRAKRWVLGADGCHWLRKEPRPLRPYEPAVEALMLQLAREAGLPAAEGAACEWVEAGQHKRGIVVRSFVDRAREQLASGTELLSRHDTSYKPEAKWEHTVERVRDVLAQQEARGGQDLILDFARMLAFDAWIGNGDRHQDNWSVIIREDSGVCRLAPMYDPAACLGTEWVAHAASWARGSIL